MARDIAELYIQRADLQGREAECARLLRQMPGVLGAQMAGSDPESIELRVRVEFDPGATNPVVLREALERAGFTVMSAAERGGAPEKGPATRGLGLE